MACSCYLFHQPFVIQLLAKYQGNLPVNWRSFLKGTTTISLLGRGENKSSPNIVFAETKFMRTVMCFVGLDGAADEACPVGIFFWFFKRFKV